MTPAQPTSPRLTHCNREQVRSYNGFMVYAISGAPPNPVGASLLAIASDRCQQPYRAYCTFARSPFNATPAMIAPAWHS